MGERFEDVEEQDLGDGVPHVQVDGQRVDGDITAIAVRAQLVRLFGN